MKVAANTAAQANAAAQIQLIVGEAGPELRRVDVGRPGEPR
jgi:hypothetical protein